MHIHLPHNLRAYLAFSVVMIIVAIWIILKNSGMKDEYSHITGKLTYLDKHLSDLPNRDFGSNRYFKIENYAYPFEVYADKQSVRIDSLKIGDRVTAYFYETDNTHEEQINRYLQFLQKSNKMYFERTDFTQQLGYVIILMMLIFAYFCYHFYKAGKIPY